MPRRPSRAFWSFLGPPSALDIVRYRVRLELPIGQLRVALALVCLPEDPLSYTEIAEGLNLHLVTVHTHLRRIRLGRPRLYAMLMAERHRQLAERHSAVVEERRVRSLAWGRRRYAARFRAEHGRWPWQDFEA
jgi:hypothetical protein